MALSKSVVSELLEGFRAGEGEDLVRESVWLGVDVDVWCGRGGRCRPGRDRRRLDCRRLPLTRRVNRTSGGPPSADVGSHRDAPGGQGVAGFMSGRPDRTKHHHRG